MQRACLVVCLAACSETFVIGDDLPGPNVTVSIVPNVAEAEAPPYMAWNSVWLAADGRTVEGNIDPSSAMPPFTTDNSIRWFDPRARTHGRRFESNGSTSQWSSYENRIDLYWESRDWWISMGAAIFDLGSGAFVAGNIAGPAEPPDFWTQVAITSSATEVRNAFTTGWYSGAAFACSDLDIVGWLGGGLQVEPVDLFVLVRANTGAGSEPIALDARPVPRPALPIAGIRHAVCVGSSIYVGGGHLMREDQPNAGFWRIDLTPNGAGFDAVATELAPWPADLNFPYVGYDPDRAQIVVIGDGIYVYGIATDEWTGDLAPDDWDTRWPNLGRVMGFFEPDEGLFYFRGRYDNDFEVDYGTTYSTLDLVPTP